MAADSALVLGHRGMLGAAVSGYLRERGWEVYTSENRWTPGGTRLLDEVRATPARVVVNAAGAIPQKKPPSYAVNAELPRDLCRVMRRDQWLVHASSDCVFGGGVAPYAMRDSYSPTDEYGRSKTEGEQCLVNARATIIRVAIVGTTGGLLRWIMDSTSSIKGYVNWFWNGITVLQWAKLCHSIARDPQPGVVQPASWPPQSKADFVQQAVDTWRIPITVERVSSDQTVDRSLFPTERVPSLGDQLAELRDWSARRMRASSSGPEVRSALSER